MGGHGDAQEELPHVKGVSLPELGLVVKHIGVHPQQRVVVGLPTFKEAKAELGHPGHIGQMDVKDNVLIDLQGGISILANLQKDGLEPAQRASPMKEANLEAQLMEVEDL